MDLVDPCESPTYMDESMQISFADKKVYVIHHPTLYIDRHLHICVLAIIINSFNLCINRFISILIL